MALKLGLATTLRAGIAELGRVKSDWLSYRSAIISVRRVVFLMRRAAPTSPPNKECIQMLDCQAKFRDLEVRVAGLEDATFSGMPGEKIATRINSLHDRVGMVGENVQDKIEREIGTLRTEMKAGFAAVDGRFAKVDERFDTIDGRFAKVDERFDTIDGRFAKVDERFDAMDERFTKVDERFDAMDERFTKVDERFDEVDNRLSLVESSVRQVQSNVFDVWTEVTMINKDSGRRDLRVDKIEKRLDGIETVLLRIEGKLPN
ncbi:hypothetical protein ACFOY2_45565 [Nonomuraea purpurea]|uniref:t-SNARE coiled-coil homology domain-containing protein n=1 Tax=Nonomuraea purpurea TaxID=1849276 RepID=A0ABV8GNM7_9ACTN